MRDSWYGEYGSEIATGTTKAPLAVLVDRGGPGSLRLRATTAQLLVELTSLRIQTRHPPRYVDNPNRSAPTTAATAPSGNRGTEHS